MAERNISQAEFDSRTAAVRIAQAQVDRLKADQDRQRERVRRHDIRAPFSGVISQRFSEKGEWVTPGTAVLELVETENLRVDTEVPQRFLSSFNDLESASIDVNETDGPSIAATIDALVPVANRNTRTFTLRLAPEDASAVLSPGMSVAVTLVFKSGETGIVVPRDAVLRYSDGRTTVWVTAADSGETTVEERQVTLGAVSDGNVYILAGLEPGAFVVVRGNESLAPGDRVRITSLGG